MTTDNWTPPKRGFQPRRPNRAKVMIQEDAKLRAEFERRVRWITRKKYKIDIPDERLQELCDMMWKMGVLQEFDDEPKS